MLLAHLSDFHLSANRKETTLVRDDAAAAARRVVADVRILAGHIHRPVQARWAGRFAAVAGSPAFQVSLDLTGLPQEPRWIEEPYAYYLHRFDAHGDVAIHTRYLDLGCC